MTGTSQSRKRRGRDTELLAARYLAEHGWPYAMPTGAGAAGRDITGTPGLAFEVKARAGFEPMANLRQAIKNAGGDLPLVLLRPNGMGPTTLDIWPVFMPLSSAVYLLRKAGYGDPLGEDEP
jgi:hypothetical protein